MLLAEELFETGDPRFLVTLKTVSVLRGTISVKAPYGNRMVDMPTPFARKVQKPHMMTGFAAKWLSDPRPWARAQLIQYIDSSIDRPGHRSLVKHLLKGAETKQDNELIGHFFAAIDRLRKLTTKKRWNHYARPAVQETVILRVKPRAPNAFHFTQRTRIYLQRRIVRYMRALSSRDATAFRKTTLEILTRYEDAQFASGQALLDVRALVSILFVRSPVLKVEFRAIKPRVGADLALLEPKMLGRKAWVGQGREVLAALPSIPSLFIRRHVTRWLERDFPETLTNAPFEVIERFVGSNYPDLRLLGSKMIERAEGLETLRIETWLSFLQGDDAEVLLTLVKRMSDLVTPARASLAQCVSLARHVAHAPAMLGIEWAETKTIDDKDALEEALPILDATVDEVRERALRWLTPILAKEGIGLDAHVRELLDARHADVRQRAFRMMDQTLRFKDSIVLWAALS